jgi:predicted O-linked N-acetylglucosamine transferase (SPINDLY family)
MLDQAVQHHRAGRLSEAEVLYRKVLSERPNDPDALHLLGLIAFQTDRHPLAVDLITRAISAQPSNAESHHHLGLALRAFRRNQEGISAFVSALRLKPDYAQAHNDLGAALKDQGRLEDATRAYRDALRCDPKLPEAHFNLGLAMQQQGDHAQAMSCFRNALSLKPAFADAYNSVGNLFFERQEIDAAADAYAQAVRANPRHAEAHSNLGVIHQMRGDMTAAAEAYHRAIELQPSYAPAHNNLGLLRKTEGKLDEAIAAYRQSLALQPEYPAALKNLALVLQMKGDPDQSMECYRKAIAMAPNDPTGYDGMGNVLRTCGRLDEALACFDRAISLQPSNAIWHSQRLFTLLFHPRVDDAELLRESRHWNDLHAQPLRHLIYPHTNDKVPDRRLRVGYISPNFNDHVLAFFHSTLFRNHDRRTVELVCYNVGRTVPFTLTMRGYADLWRDCQLMDDDRLAGQIRADRIDILVDLTMHMGGNRLLLFAQKPAPVQVTWSAYPGTTGLEAIDYRLTDPYLDPPGQHDQNYSEKSIRLPDTFWCYDPLQVDLPFTELPALRQGHVTFGSMNNICKVNPEVLRMWSAVLEKVETSRMVILADPGEYLQGMLAVLVKEGVDPRRVEFVPRRERREYLQLYNRLDIILDTFPYNGHTTTLDALWMGVPVVTRVGQRVVSRAGLCLLSNLGLGEMAAHGSEEFVTIAAALAADLPRLASLRATLRDRIAGSPLMDGARFARNVETAYRQMWRTWCGTSGS